MGILDADGKIVAVPFKDTASPEQILDAIQTLLDLAGLIPVFGEIADGTNAVIYLLRGDYVNASLSAISMIPLWGWIPAVGKIGTKAAKLVKAGEQAEDFAKIIAKNLDYVDDAVDFVDVGRVGKNIGSEIGLNAGKAAKGAGKAANNAAEGAGKAAKGTGKAAEGAGSVDRPYSSIGDSSSVGPGKKFTKVQKDNIIQENMRRNDGVVRSDLSGTELTRPQKSQSGVKPDSNEWQIDHIDPRSKGGANSYGNAQVLSRKENRTKWNK